MLPLTRNHVPARYADPIEQDYILTTTDALRAALDWLEDGARLLVLAGGVGVGKSFAAAKAVHDWRLKNALLNPWGKLVACEGRLWIASQHLARLQSWAADVIALEDPGILVLDDLGEEEATPKALAMISTLLSTRFADGKRTIITTNLDQRDFRPRYGERVVDRVRECGLDADETSRWWVKCTGSSLRGKVEPLPRPVLRDEEPEEPEAPLPPEQLTERASGFLRALSEGERSEKHV
jgi:hypothetical protein